MQLVFVYPARRIGAVPLPNIWLHVAVGLGLVLQALTVVLPPLRALLGLVPVGAPIFAAITVAVLFTWAIAEFIGRGGRQH
jgi:P-type Ca2+ transporter type 2C